MLSSRLPCYPGGSRLRRHEEGKVRTISRPCISPRGDWTVGPRSWLAWSWSSFRIEYLALVTKQQAQQTKTKSNAKNTYSDDAPRKWTSISVIFSARADWLKDARAQAEISSRPARASSLRMQITTPFSKLAPARKRDSWGELHEGEASRDKHRVSTRSHASKGGSLNIHMNSLPCHQCVTHDGGVFHGSASGKFSCSSHQGPNTQKQAQNRTIV